MLQKLKNVDYFLLAIVACLGVISTFAIMSATIGTKYEGLHLTNIKMFGAFFLPMLALAFIDYRFLIRFLSIPLYVIGIGMLVWVLIQGVNLLGAERWLTIGSFQFQPSELMKLFTIMLFAFYLARRKGEPLRFVHDILPLIALIGLPIALILKQPDLGTSMVFICIFIGMLWMGNIRPLFMFIGLSLMAAGSGVLVWLYKNDLLSKVLKGHQMARIKTFLDPDINPDYAWHVNNSLSAISSGQLTGEGFGQGFYVQNGFIPYVYSDSIYVVIGEEFGFVGSAVLLLLYFLMIYRMIQIALDSKDLSGSYLVIGIISMLTLQIVENIAMHIGLLPLTGIPLPFISYGGSSLLINMIAIGFVLSVKSHSRTAVT